jgi:hypothetical protein
VSANDRLLPARDVVRRAAHNGPERNFRM